MVKPPMPESLKGKRILLASNSPRRRELLGLIIPDFEIAKPVDVDERYPEDLPAFEVAPFLSLLKANAYRNLLCPDEIIITADTVVILDDKILGKPHSREEAIEMLMDLQGKTHHVVTGVTLTSTDRVETFSETTAVKFAPLSKEIIEQYVDVFNPLDKAGSYGIQEWLGCIGITGIDGDYYNVMGLPLHNLYNHLVKF